MQPSAKSTRGGERGEAGAAAQPRMPSIGRERQAPAGKSVTFFGAPATHVGCTGHERTHTVQLRMCPRMCPCTAHSCTSSGDRTHTRGHATHAPPAHTCRTRTTPLSTRSRQGRRRSSASWSPQGSGSLRLRALSTVAALPPPSILSSPPAKVSNAVSTPRTCVEGERGHGRHVPAARRSSLQCERSSAGGHDA